MSDTRAPSGEDGAGSLARWLGPAVVGVWLLAADRLARVPGAEIVVTLVVAWSLLAWIDRAARARELPVGDGWILALAGFLAWPVLGRHIAGALGIRVPEALTAGLLLEGLAVGLGVALVAVLTGPLGRPWAMAWRSVAVVGAALGGLGLAVLVGLAWPLETGTGVVLLLVAGALGLALVLQRALARQGPWERLRGLAEGPALLVAGAQLLDGLVSYLAVRDPLGLLDGRFQEEVALSALVLDAAGPLYPLAKWGIALAFVLFLEQAERGAGELEGRGRVGAYLLVVLFGLGPGLFSAIQLLG